jgi:hypothetical protein
VLTRTETPDLSMCEKAHICWRATADEDGYYCFAVAL